MSKLKDLWKMLFGKSSVEIHQWGFDLLKIAEKAVKVVVGDTPIELVYFRVSAPYFGCLPQQRRLRIDFKYKLEDGQVWDVEMIVLVTLGASHPATRIKGFGEILLRIGGVRFLKLDLTTNPPKILQDYVPANS